MEIEVLRKHGFSLRRIAAEVGCAVNTVRSHLAAGEKPKHQRQKKRPSKLSPYEAYLRERQTSAQPLWISVLNRCLKEICISFKSPLTPSSGCPLQAPSAQNNNSRFHTNTTTPNRKITSQQRQNRTLVVVNHYQRYISPMLPSHTGNSSNGLCKLCRITMRNRLPTNAAVRWKPAHRA